jgi:2'-5' RNA ligase
MAEVPRPLRLFVACELPREVHLALAEWQRRGLESHREVRLNHALHLTLAFLGDTDPDAVDQLTEVLAAIAWAPACTGVAGSLFLPAHGLRHVVALELSDPDGALRALQERVSAALVATGLYEAPRRPWLPHVTVARFRRPGKPFSLQNVTLEEFCAVRMALYSSSLESTGAVHTPLATFPAS